MAISSDEILAQGALMCVLCPVASSVTVVAAMLGANPERTTTYTIVGNLLVSIVAPIYISLIRETSSNSNLGLMFLLIFTKIAVVIALPFILVLCLQKFLPKTNTKYPNTNSSHFIYGLLLFLSL